MRTRTFSPSDQIFIERSRWPFSSGDLHFQRSDAGFAAEQPSHPVHDLPRPLIVRAVRRLDRRGMTEMQPSKQCQRQAYGHSCFVPSHNRPCLSRK